MHKFFMLFFMIHSIQTFSSELSDELVDKIWDLQSNWRDDEACALSAQLSAQDNINKTFHDKETLLIRSIQHYKRLFPIAQKLLELHASVDAQDDGGRTALYWICSQLPYASLDKNLNYQDNAWTEEIKIIRALLQAQANPMIKGIDIDKQRAGYKNRNSPLELAANRNNALVCEMLLKAQAKRNLPFQLDDRFTTKNPKIKKLLLKYIPEKCRKVSEYSGWDIIWIKNYVVPNKVHEIAHLINTNEHDEANTLAQTLFTKDNINQRIDEKNSTLLHKAACHPSALPTLQRLIKLGALLNVSDNDHKTPLMLAIINCNNHYNLNFRKKLIGNIQYLLAAGADYSSVETNEDTPPEIKALLQFVSIQKNMKRKLK